MLKILTSIMMFFILTLNVFAVIPEIYSSAGYLRGTNKIADNSSANNGYAMKLGVRPITLPIPILSNFRIEAQYEGSKSKVLNYTAFGAGLYYDLITILPIVTPYVGVGVLQSDFTFRTNNFSDALQQKGDTKKNAKILTLTAGIDAKIPIMGLSGYAEYRYANTATFKSNIVEFAVDHATKRNFVSQGIFIGLSYKFL